ncbi:hypothetical protein [Croceibacterium aestuarii]|uniref:hypothetical protein n=1 Tax=Croceibacterium aestuarii TaxID=3064139 RepID=UPI00272E1C41|nr:hypothetical protein [Croceibacterium sp. D39]
MKIPIAAATALALTAVGAPAAAQQSSIKAKSPEVVEHNARGKATKVKVDNVVYDVCTSEQQDHCIQPRAAGLRWGDRPLNYWPDQKRS